ncbi:MAG: cyclodeaminase/cyclohydrolase family protein [Candidatus Thermoplasmatota archaeon]|jgi:formiminotetrahydrofolate cyclodeaminase|nr:cyclodeaminase/cyclohydrolase family protein [Candidatus Thermoplasmatota archaeon]MCL5790923.1 cyclodeaminase/cyclohydrolase family protein [Candidatus Thermoplasmatota archaeon]
MIDLNRFIVDLASDSPAPGGGAASAVTGIVAVSLCSMVSGLSMKKKGYEEKKREFESILAECTDIRNELSDLAELDTAAFNGIMESRRLPRSTEEEKKRRDKAIANATKSAISSPWRIAATCRRVAAISLRLLDMGLPGAITDAGASLNMAVSAIESSLLNVSINLKYMNDKEYVESEKMKIRIFMEDVNLMKKQGEGRIVSSIGKEFMW